MFAEVSPVSVHSVVSDDQSELFADATKEIKKLMVNNNIEVNGVAVN